LDAVFSVPMRRHARYYMNSVPWYIKKYIKRGDVEPRGDLVEQESTLH